MNESWHLLRLSTPKLQLITEDVTQARAHPADIAKIRDNATTGLRPDLIHCSGTIDRIFVSNGISSDFIFVTSGLHDDCIATRADEHSCTQCGRAQAILAILANCLAIE
jgi:hypothetical protein